MHASPAARNLFFVLICSLTIHRVRLCVVTMNQTRVCGCIDFPRLLCVHAEHIVWRLLRGKGDISVRNVNIRMCLLLTVFELAVIQLLTDLVVLQLLTCDSVTCVLNWCRETVWPSGGTLGW